MTVHLFLGGNARKRHLIYRYNSPFVSYYTTCAAWNFEKLKMLPVSFFSGVLRSLDLNSFDYKLKSGEQCSSDRKNDGTILPSSYLHRLEQTVIDEIISDVWDVAFVPEADTEYRRFDFWAVDLTFDVVALSTFWQFFYKCITERILKIHLYFATIMTTSRLCVLCARKCGGAFAGTTSVRGWTSRAVLWAYRRCLACVSHIAAVTSTRTPDSRSRSPSHTSSDTSAPQPAFTYYSLAFAPSLTSICCCGLVYLRNWGWICTS